MLKKQLPFWLFTFVLIIGLTVPVLVQDGMFLDGIWYSTVSKNMANGLGTFWQPYFSEAGFNGFYGFYEHLPFVFGIQSIFFKLFGNSIYTERIYVFFTLVISVALIVLVWKRVNQNEIEKKSGWLPLLFWIMMPVIFWTFTNNMQENTMGIFVLLAVWFYFKSSQNKPALVFLAGVSVFLASFSKGIPGLFPLGVPFLYWMSTHKISFRKMILDSSIMIFTVAVIYLVLISFSESRENLYNYFFKRLLSRIESNPTVDSRFQILYDLFLNLLLPLIIISIVYFILKIKKQNTFEKEKIQLALFFLLLGLAGTLPLMLTKVQRGFYFVQALPFFAIGFSLLISRPVNELCNNIISGKTKRVLTLISALMLIAVLCVSFSMIGKTKRDKETLHDVYILGNQIEKRTTMGAPEEMFSDYTFEAYLMRHFEISVITRDTFPCFVTKKKSTKAIPEGFTKVELPTLVYDLYLRKE